MGTPTTRVTSSRIFWMVTWLVCWPAECSPPRAPCPLASLQPTGQTDSSPRVRSSSTDSRRDLTSTSSHSKRFYQHHPIGVKPRRSNNPCILSIDVFYLVFIKGPLYLHIHKK